MGADRMKALERYILLQTIDDKWKDHLHALDYLRTGVGMRGYGQEDPKIVYRREAAEMFDQMISAIQDQVVDLLYRVEPPKDERDLEPSEDEPAPGAGDGTGFDEDVWGEDDDPTDWDEVARADEERAVAAAAAAAAEAATAPQASRQPVTAAGAAPVATASPTRPGMRRTTPAQPTYRDRQQVAESLRTRGRPAGDPLFERAGAGPNDPCPCGSGKKYKKCHGG